MEPDISGINGIISMFSVRGDEIKLLLNGNFMDSINLLSSEKKKQLLSILEYLPPPVGSDDFSVWVSKARICVGLTQSELGDLVGLKKDRICKLEQKKPNLTSDNKIKIRDTLVGLLKNKQRL